MFNPYSPYFMGQQMGQQAPFMPPMPQQPAQPAQAAQSGPDWVPAPTVKQVEQVQVQPGGKAWVMVQNEPIFALRVADNLGMVTTDYYRFEKIDPAAEAPEQQFVTRAEFQQFIDSLTVKTAQAKKEDGK